MTERVIPAPQLPGLAAELQQAEDSGVQMPPFSERFPGMTLADAYAVQRAWLARRLAPHGEGLRGR